MDGDRVELRLEGEGIRLRTFTTADVNDDFVAWLNDPQVVQYSNQRFLSHSRESCLDYLQSFAGSDNLYLAIEDVDSDRLHGSITAYRQVHHGTADIGIMVGNRQAWSRGIGYRAWGLLMAYLSSAARCARSLVARCAPTWPWCASWKSPA